MRITTRKETALAMVLGISLLLIFFRPLFSLNRIEQGTDPYCYIKKVKSYLHLDAGEKVMKVCPNSLDSVFMPGISILWLPLSALGAFLSKLTSTPVDDWIDSAIAFSATLFFLGISLFAFFLLRQGGYKNQNLVFWGGAFLLISPVIQFSVFYVSASHAGELFVAMGVFWLIHQNKFFSALLASTLLTLIRLNDILIFIPLLLSWYEHIKNKPAIQISKFNPRFGKVAFFIGTIISLSAFLSLIILGYSSDQKGFQFFQWFFSLISSAFSGNNLYRVFFSIHHGIVFTSLWWFSVLILGIGKIKYLKRSSVGCLFWMLVTFLICSGWPSHGNMGFGYRYLVGSYAGALWLWLDLKNHLSKKSLKFVEVVLSINFLLMVYLVTSHLISWDTEHSFFTLNLSSKGYAFVKYFAFSPIPVLFYSWFPELSLLVTSGTLNHLSGPRLWVFSVMMFLAVYVLAKYVFILRKKLTLPNP